MTAFKLFPAPFLLLSLLAGAMPQPAEAADVFYTRLLERGVRDLELGLTDEAQKKLRTACFGFLDEPVLLAEGLMQLGRAQAQAGNTADLTETVERLVEIEDRFNAYSSFDGALKTVFESTLRRALPEALLERMPMFAHLTVRPESAAAADQPLTRKQRRKARKLAKSSDTLEIPAQDLSPPEAVAADVTGRPAEGAPSQEPAAEPAQEIETVFPEITIGLTLEERIRRLREEVAESRFREHLDGAMQRAIELANDYPDSKPAQHLAAEVAYLSSEWQAVVDFFERGGRPSADRPELLFYLAVATYELGFTQEADSILKDALPTLPRNPFVDSYVDKILIPPRS